MGRERGDRGRGRAMGAGVVSGALLVLVGCATSPTGRRQLQLIPDQQMVQLGVQSFEEIRRQVPESDDPRARALVQCVAHRVLQEVPDPQTRWEVVLFESDDVNAFALPGGKIGVFSGMLGVAENPSQLAAVIAHEIAHVQARHSEERVSQLLVTQMGLTVADALIPASRAHQAAMAALGLGAQFGVLMPYSRAHEVEADVVGLQLMARAGFDPRQAVTLWENMAVAAQGREPPELLSTHPSSDTRITHLREHMADAIALWEGVGASPSCPGIRALAAARRR